MIRKSNAALFVSYVTGKPVTPATIGRWLQMVLRQAGVGKEFTAHSTRAAVTSALHFKGASISQIMGLANWSSAGTFAKHYHRDVSSGDVNVMDTVTH